MLVQEKGMFAFFPTLPPHSRHAKLRSRNAIQILQNLLCANSKGVQSSEECWKYTDQEACPFPSPVFPGQIPLVSMDTFRFHQNVTHWPLSPLPYRKGAQAYNSHLVIQEPIGICLSLVHIYCTSTACKVLAWS